MINENTIDWLRVVGSSTTIIMEGVPWRGVRGCYPEPHVTRKGCYRVRDVGSISTNRALIPKTLRLHAVSTTERDFTLSVVCVVIEYVSLIRAITGPQFMLLLSIHVLYSNVIHIYIYIYIYIYIIYTIIQYFLLSVHNLKLVSISIEFCRLR